MIEVLAAGPGATVQDRGRPGWAALGVGHSGALDRAALDRANALVGNDGGEAGVEITGGGLRLRSLETHVVAVSGAHCPGAPMDVAVTLHPGDELHLAPPVAGLRTYLAVAGGIDVEAVLGSRSHDQLSGLGPAPVARGDRLHVGPASGSPGVLDGVVAPRVAPDQVRIWPGPRADWFVDPLGHLCGHGWRVGDDINRVGLRLDGAPLTRRHTGELRSEGLVTGAIQVPHDGRPIVMLADHPTTGGYPVVAVVDPADLDLLAHLRPGDRLRFVLAPDAVARHGIG